jgi:hypothetical protein
MKKYARDTLPTLNKLIEEAAELAKVEKSAKAKYEKVKLQIKARLKEEGWKFYLHNSPTSDEEVLKAYLYDQHQPRASEEVAAKYLTKAQMAEVFTTALVADCFTVKAFSRATVEKELAELAIENAKE